MSERRARGSRQPATRPNFCFHASVPGTSDPTSFLFQRGQPTSAALDRSREAGTTRPLMCRRSVSVWKWNWVFTHDRILLGTYSSQIAGGSTMWLSQSKMGKSLLVMVGPPQSLRLANDGRRAGSRPGPARSGAVGPILHTRRPSARTPAARGTLRAALTFSPRARTVVIRIVTAARDVTPERRLHDDATDWSHRTARLRALLDRGHAGGPRRS